MTQSDISSFLGWLLFAMASYADKGLDWRVFLCLGLAAIVVIDCLVRSWWPRTGF